MHARVTGTAAAIAFSLLPRVAGQESVPYTEHEFFCLAEPTVTFSRRIPLGEGDGELAVDGGRVALRLVPHGVAICTASR